MVRKAQAALEFLVTYGWALLIIAIMVGALVYFGILNPKSVVTDSCQVSNPFLCKGQQLDTSGTLKLAIHYAGESVVGGKELVTATLTPTTIQATCSLSNPPASSLPMALSSNQDFTLEFSCTGANFNAGDKHSFQGTLTYRDSSTGFNSTADIKVTATVVG